MQKFEESNLSGDSTVAEWGQAQGVSGSELAAVRQLNLPDIVVGDRVPVA
jgi:hypothetical protein